MNFRRLLFYFSVLFIASLTACQDDPDLEPVVDGVPVITPKSRAYITAIQLNQFPALDPMGNTWDSINPTVFDSLGNPDIFFNITIPEPNPPVLWSQYSHFSNLIAGDTIPFFLLDQFEVVPFGTNIDLNIYDYELPDSTLMGTLPFFIGEYPDPTNPYPQYISSSQNGYSVTISLRYLD